MAPAPDIVFYASIHSRSFTVRWMLAELDLPHRIVDTHIRSGKQKDPAYLAINPMGKVPAITDGGVVVTETPAICLYLADRYGYGTLAPAVDDPARGPYLRWSVFATAAFEPGIYMHDRYPNAGGRGFGWGTYDDVRRVVEDALRPGPWILGERFSAADVILGSILSVALFNKRLPETETLAAYNARITARPACQA
ncbi:MAG TPA: glutathione S-transferase family protein, partial [Caulobacteraceae bacterium]|nr:glutathione S-transferase family protein [Caulobacteraceae bacterium]